MSRLVRSQDGARERNARKTQTNLGKYFQKADVFSTIMLLVFSSRVDNPLSVSGFFFSSLHSSSHWPGVYPNIWWWVRAGGRLRALLIEWKSVEPLELYPSNKRKLFAPSHSHKIAQTVHFSHFLKVFLSCEDSRLKWSPLLFLYLRGNKLFSLEDVRYWARESRIIVLSWSLIPSQQDNNNNTMTSLDKQRHSIQGHLITLHSFLCGLFVG